MKTINEQVCNITKQFYLEPVTKEAALNKIKLACEAKNVKFLPEKILFDSVLIHGAWQLKFQVNWANIEKALKLNYDHDPIEFRKVYACYEAATFRLDRKWYDQNLARCVKFFYTGGIEFLTSKTGSDHRSADHYLSISCTLATLDRAKQVEAIYFN